MKRASIIFILLFSTIFTTSCWSRREIEDLGFVLGLGVSKTDEGLYSVVVQVANPDAIAADSSAKRDVYTIIKAEGLTVFDALRNMSMIAGRRLYIAHIKALVIDESVAKEGIRQVVSFLVQDMEVRLEMEVFISKIPPEEIFDTPNILRAIPASVMNIVAENFGANNKIYVANLHETAEAINNPVLNYVTTLVEKLPSPSEKELPQLKLSQIAIFDDDKLKGYLDYEESQAFNLITNNFRNGLIAFEYAPTNDKIIVESLSGTPIITPDYKDGKVSFDIELKVEGNVAERIVKGDSAYELDIIFLQNQLNQTLTDKLNKAICDAQQKYEVDYFNLSQDFFRKYPKEFKELKDDWNQVFSQADINVRVESTLLHSALNLNRGRI
ncbi:spore germination protein KC [Clostridium aceticum]|uniref:Spore germination protein KC n=1 Tax=Clostridium aceticum TaxID=84022 RepID=A0A0D8IHH7_9CLOT|nr:Ger(x)C family spore germination protein [Clostridium aceticum]AKL93992.1 spore germination protein KC [Clostridium aceticum]KJF28626.1 hypothetical protein TZ02_01585 [Clostridium aceticum]